LPVDGLLELALQSIVLLLRDLTPELLRQDGAPQADFCWLITPPKYKLLFHKLTFKKHL